MSKYKLSIIVPTFNLENKLEKTFDSIKKQTIGFNNIELIFVDDCSEDETYSILSRYDEDYDNVTVLKTNENSGFAGKPRNLGLENSNADYVLFLDGDDQLLIDSCAVLYNYITSNNSDIVIGGHINQYENGRLEHIPPMYFGRNETFKEVINPTLFKIMPAIGAKLFKKELLIKNNISFPEGISGQDLVFLLNSIINSKEINVLNNFYVYYRNIDVNSVTFNLNEKYFYGLIEAYSLICDLFKKHDLNHDIQEMLLTGHLGFFTTQVLRAFSSPDFDNNALIEILNSDTFDTLSKKEIFQGNVIYDEFFNNLKSGYYNNHKLLKKITAKFKPELINEYCFLKDNNIKLNQENEKLISENNDLKNNFNKLENKNTILNEELIDLKDKISELINENKNLKKNNDNLNNENNNLKNELNEIKSSKLWKIKNKL